MKQDTREIEAKKRWMKYIVTKKEKNIEREKKRGDLTEMKKRHKQIGETIVITVARFSAQDELKPNEKDRERICAVQRKCNGWRAFAIWMLRVHVFIYHATHTNTAQCCLACIATTTAQHFYANFVLMRYAFSHFLWAFSPKLLTLVWYFILLATHKPSLFYTFNIYSVICA